MLPWLAQTPRAVNDKSSTVQKFCGSLDFRENFHVFAFAITNYLYIHFKECHNPKTSRENFRILLQKLQKFLSFTVYVLAHTNVHTYAHTYTRACTHTLNLCISQ